ncbi:MAG: BON domain-containing protein [Planctomycetaceae bacterium]|nr:BON domain-containing protein [Planctomycetaceae bacterium]
MKRSSRKQQEICKIPMALDDPVPAGSSISIERPECVEPHPHAIERDVRKRLENEKGIRFMELVVRRMPGGICLDGVVHTDGECPDVAKVVREIANVEQVVNHLLVLPAVDEECDIETDLNSAFDRS